MEGVPAVHTHWVTPTPSQRSVSCLHTISVLPSLLQIVAKKYRDYDIPFDMSALRRYMRNAYARDEFTNTCAADSEIELAYADVAKRLSRS